VRQQHQARAVNEVVSAMKPSPSWTPTGAFPPPLRVVNGMPTPTSSSVTNPRISPHNSTPTTGSRVAGLPSASPLNSPTIGRPGGSTLKWGAGLAAGLPAHEEVDRESVDFDSQETEISHADPLLSAPPPPRKPITPSLETLEKAVSARIFFENLYFPLLRQPNSREQRRLAMEQDMNQMGLNEDQKDALRARWRQNETDYLRERRSKVDPSAFKLYKTIGHGNAISFFGEFMQKLM
jgi:protein-serine/threonine kinase